MIIHNFDATSFLLFFSAFVRVAILFAVFPIFSNNAIPLRIKILFSFLMIIVLFPLIKNELSGIYLPIRTVGDIFTLVIKEFIVGLLIGFVAKVIFESISFGFSYLGIQMGFGFSVLYDPNSEYTSPIVSQFVVLIASLLFIVFEGHHFIIRSISETFHIIPLGLANVKKIAFIYVVDVGRQLFWIAIKLGAPVAISIFIMNITFGILSKAVPQINVLILSFTVNIIIGLFILLIIVTVLDENVENIMNHMFYHVFNILRYFHV